MAFVKSMGRCLLFTMCLTFLWNGVGVDMFIVASVVGLPCFLGSVVGLGCSVLCV